MVCFWIAFSALTLTLLVACQEGHLAWLSVWSVVQMICIWSSWCNCHPIISCVIKIQSGLTFLVSAYPGCAGKMAVKWVSVFLYGLFLHIQPSWSNKMRFCVLSLQGLKQVFVAHVMITTDSWPIRQQPSVAVVAAFDWHLSPTSGCQVQCHKQFFWVWNKMDGWWFL